MVAVTVTFLLLLIFEKASLDALGIGLIVVIAASGVVEPAAAVAGFANKAVLTIAGLYVVGEGLTRTGAVDFLGRLLTGFSGGSEQRIVLFTCIAAATMSAFLNDTAVVVVFVPILLDMARRHDVPASRLMMPLAYSALLGGMCTLVGTSTNLIVSGAAEVRGAEPLGMFTMTPVGISVAVACIAFITAFSRRLLPERQSLTVVMAAADAREYVTEMSIGAHSPLVGKPYREALAATALQVICFVRDEHLQRPPWRDEVVAAGDVLMLQGGIEALTKAQQGMDLHSLAGGKIDPRNVEMFEVALSPNTSWHGRRVADLHLYRDYGVTVMAVMRAGRHIHERVGQRRVGSGDLLLVVGDAASQKRLQASQEFRVLAGDPQPLRIRSRAVLALVVAACVMIVLALGSIFEWKNLPPSSAALGGAVAMVIIGATTARRAYAAIDWSILVFLAGTLALGEAMQRSGVAELIADAMLGVVAGLGPAAVVSAMIGLCFLFNFLISHSAVAVLFTPIAIAAAAGLAAAPGGPDQAAMTRAMVLAVCFGGSLCFATPIAHQVNLMVYGPGGYRYRDFLKLGLPVALIAWLVASVGIVWLTGV